MRYLSIVAIWLFCYFAPAYAGTWWDDYLQVCNALVSAFLLFAVLKIHRCWWTLDLACLCILQIIFNFGDLIFNLSVDHYAGILTLFNTIELGIIVGLGGPYELWKFYVRKRGDDSDSGGIAQKVADGLQPRAGDAS